MKKKYIIILSIISIAILLSSFTIYYQQDKKRKELFQNKTITLANDKIVEQQKKINDELDNIAKEKKYTLENAYIKLNPYEISPLSAIIIFETEDKESFKVYINEEFVTTTEETTTHTIPIYGLLENKNNKIKLTSENKEKEYFIQTEKSNLLPLEIMKKSEKLNDDLYFMTASYISGLSAYDKNGNLRFYLTEPYRMDVEWLENGHFLIGVPNGHFAENFYAFVEMDYLGKIYNYYSLEHGFSFETQILKNGNYLIAGGENPVYINKQYITEINPQNGETVNTINIYDIFKNIDPEFPDKYLGQAAIRNGFYQNEENQDLIVSFRGMNAIICINYETKQLNWIFTNPQNELFQKKEWQKYLVKSTENDYPWGQHAPIITKEGYIGFFNNGYDRYHGFEVGGSDLLSEYQNNYSRAEIYEIRDMTAKKIWNYDGNKQLFSHQYGSLKITNEQTKLINFGWTLKKDYRKEKDAKLSTSEQNIDNTYAYIVELDKNDNILLEAKCEEGKYRVFKHNLYKDKTENINLSSLNQYNTIPREEIKIQNISNDTLKEAPTWNDEFEISKNYFKSTYALKTEEELELCFINKQGKNYSMIYKKANDSITNRIFNIELPKGEYLVYIKLNGTLWKTNTIIEF